MKIKLKLYVWYGFYPNDGDGLAVAIARSEADARKQIEASAALSDLLPITEWGKLTVHPLTKRFAIFATGGN